MTRRCPNCGAPRLTGRQDQILALIANGATTLEIAVQLQLSVQTIRWHIKATFIALDVHNRSGAIAVARELGIIT